MDTPAFLTAHEKVLNILRKFGVPTTKCKHFLPVETIDNTLTFMLYNDGRELVGFDVIVQGKKFRVYQEMFLESEIWLGILEERFPEVEK
jgi:hypothetical protein